MFKLNPATDIDFSNLEFLNSTIEIMIPIRLRQEIISQVSGIESRIFGKKIKSPKIKSKKKLNNTSTETINPIVNELYLSILIAFV